MRLALGTAQLGMPYGSHPVAPDYGRALEVVRASWEGGVRIFDTAQAYGESERFLGMAFKELGLTGQVRVVTKLRKDDDLRLSRKRLGVQNLWAVLGHGWIDELKADGASVHHPHEAMEALERVGMIQVPAGAFDRRMERAGVFERARELGKTVFVRSVLLRGLAFRLPSYLTFCMCNHLDPRRFAIDYALERTEGTLVIGADDAKQATENCEAVRDSTPSEYADAWEEVWKEDVELARH